MVKIVVVTGFGIALLPLLLMLAVLGGVSSGTGENLFFVILAWPGRAGWWIITLFLSVGFFSASLYSMFSAMKKKIGASLFIAGQFLVAGALCILAAVYILGASAVK